jgi:uncharacterized protein DUF3489
VWPRVARNGEKRSRPGLSKAARETFAARTTSGSGRSSRPPRFSLTRLSASFSYRPARLGIRGCCGSASRSASQSLRWSRTGPGGTFSTISFLLRNAPYLAFRHLIRSFLYRSFSPVFRLAFLPDRSDECVVRCTQHKETNDEHTGNDDRDRPRRRRKLTRNRQRRRRSRKRRRSQRQPRRTTRILMKRKEGATLAEIAKATNWQNQSIRGFVSGHVIKKLGLKVESTKRIR